MLTYLRESILNINLVQLLISILLAYPVYLLLNGKNNGKFVSGVFLPYGAILKSSIDKKNGTIVSPGTFVYKIDNNVICKLVETTYYSIIQTN